VDRRSFDNIVTTLALRCWSNEYLDDDLRDALDACLRSLNAAAVIVHFDREDVTLVHAERPHDEAAITELARCTFPELTRKKIDQRFGELHAVGSWIFEKTHPHQRADSLLAKSDPQAAVMGYSVICFNDLPEEPVDRDRFVTFHSRTSTGLLFQTFQHRARLFLPFAPRWA